MSRVGTPSTATVRSLGGTSDWATQSADLSAFDGKNVQIRFRLTSDGSVSKDGFSMDKLVVVGDPKSNG